MGDKQPSIELLGGRLKIYAHNSTVGMKYSAGLNDENGDRLIYAFTRTEPIVDISHLIFGSTHFLLNTQDITAFVEWLEKEGRPYASRS